MALQQLKKDATGAFTCPGCGRPLRFVEGGAVRVIDGKLDMENIKPKYECDACGVFYRETIVDTGLYDHFPLPKKKKIVRTGDLGTMQLKKDQDGHCTCPRCGEQMDFVEGQPVRIVDGKPDMENVYSHFFCKHCQSRYRRIVNTDYYQYCEK